MYAAAGGASLASRQARRKQKQHHTAENLHQQFHKRFQQLQHQHAPACADGYHYMRTSSSGFLSPSHLPSCTDLHARGAAAIDFSLHEHLLEGKSSVAWLEREKKGGGGGGGGGGLSPFSEIAPPLIAQHSHGKLKISEAQRKWAKKNKIHDSSLGECSSVEDLRGGLHHQYDAAANMLLYIGLCAVALGLVIAFVGTGEKGFKTVQLRLIGPTMIGCGVFCCVLRILFCFCPTRCMRKSFKHRHKNKNGLSDAAQLNRHGGVLSATEKLHMEYYKHLPFRSQMSNNNFLLFDHSGSPILTSITMKDKPTNNANNVNNDNIINMTSCGTTSGSSNNNNNNNNRNKKRVSIAPFCRPPALASASASASASAPPLPPPPFSFDRKRMALFNDNKVPEFIIDDAASDSLSTLRELSPLHEEDLIDFQQSTNSFENFPSFDSSLEYLNEQLNEDSNLFTSNKDFSQSLATEEQWSRLKSTLTFRDSIDLADNRLMISCDEFDLQDEFKFIRNTSAVTAAAAPETTPAPPPQPPPPANKSAQLEENLSDFNLNQELVLSVGALERKN